MGIIALYDTVSIQGFIYNSNRLRDNRGASLLVEDCFQKYLKKAICNVIKEESKDESKCCLDWEKNEAADFICNTNIKCEIIYIGGGNAQVYFESKNLYKSVNTEFSQLLLCEIPEVTVVSECVEVNNNDDYGKLVNALFQKLQVKKMKHRGMMCTPALSVTRECNYTRKSAVVWDKEDDRWLSEEISKKRERAKDERDSEYYAEVEMLAGEEGEQWVATVHIDGNAMGENINKLLENRDLSEGIKRIRIFSRAIQKIYTDSYKQMLQKMILLLETCLLYTSPSPRD